MNNVKFTGVNIAAALLFIGFFLTWVSNGRLDVSGFKFATTGISPGELSYMVEGTSRLLMALMILVPVCAGLILYQNISGNMKFSKYYKPAEILPAVLLIIGIVVLYFKLQPAPVTPDNSFGGMNMDAMRQKLGYEAPGIFDVMQFGAYLSIAASIYLLLASLGKIKDKEYYKPTVSSSQQTTSNQE